MGDSKDNHYTSRTPDRCARRKRSPDNDHAASPCSKRVKTLASVVVISDWRKDCRPRCSYASERHGSPYNKRCRRLSTESREGTSSGEASRSNSADSGDLGYCSQHGTTRCNSARSKWRSGIKGTEKRGMCKCKRHSDSGLKTKSTQNRPAVRDRSAERRRRREREKQRDEEKENKREKRTRRRRDRGTTECRSKRLIIEDKEGQLTYRENEIIRERYQLGRTLGRGTFGQVVECRDLKRKEKKVAMKIVRKGCQDYESAVMEVRVLEAIQKNDPDMTSGCIEMLDWFDYDGHICIVFEMLGHSVYEFLRRNSYRPFPIDQVQLMVRQLCEAVLFCHEHGITHTDLKPENILFCNSTFEFVQSSPGCQWRDAERRVRRADIKLIDFGSALFDYESHGSVISTRQYRAPEVILDLGWSYSADVWSIGCIVFEMCIGKTLFQTHDTLEHLAMIERILGRLPSHMVNKSSRKRYFRDGRLKWDVKSKDGRKLDKKCRPLKTYMPHRTSAMLDLFDLLRDMLEIDPSRRITLSEALRHPFFSHRL